MLVKSISFSILGLQVESDTLRLSFLSQVQDHSLWTGPRKEEYLYPLYNNYFCT